MTPSVAAVMNTISAPIKALGAKRTKYSGKGPEIFDFTFPDASRLRLYRLEWTKTEKRAGIELVLPRFEGTAADAAFIQLERYFGKPSVKSYRGRLLVIDAGVMTLTTVALS